MEPQGDDKIYVPRIVFGYRRHVREPVEPPCPLTKWEAAVMSRILSNPFEGRDAALQQARLARVEAACRHCPTVWLTVARADQVAIMEGGEPRLGILPWELEGEDADGMPFSILVHVEKGFITQLDVFRGDSEPFLGLPDVSATRLVLC